MKPPKGPFWAWTDIGSGYKWYLCLVTAGEDETPIIKYLTGDFEDYWYDDDWDEDDIILIETPERKED